MIIIAVYVDDINIASNDTNLLNDTKTILSSRFKISDLGPIHHMLGLQVTRNPESISINQSRYTHSILKKYGMNDCHPTATPLDASIKLVPLQDDDEIMDKSLYRSTVGSLLHLAIVTRPNIETAVSMVARYIEKPGKMH